MRGVLAAYAVAAVSVTQAPNALGWLTGLGLGAIFAAFISGWMQRRKMGGDYAQGMATAAATLVGPLRREVEELRRELAEARARADGAANEVHKLSRDLTDALAELHRAEERTAHCQLEITRLRLQLKSL